MMLTSRLAYKNISFLWHSMSKEIFRRSSYALKYNSLNLIELQFNSASVATELIKINE